MSSPRPSLHPEGERMVEYLEQQGKDRYSGATVADIRKNHSLSSELMQGEVEFAGNKKDLLIPSEYNTAGLPARVYLPAELPADPTLLVYFHGGGLVLGNIKTAEAACMSLAMRASIIVVSVDYRLAPEHPFPAQVHDGRIATQWIIANKTTLGGSEASLVGIGGDSGGGTIAASVAHDVPGLAFQLLVYPRVMPARDYNAVPSQQKFQDGPLLTKSLIQWFEDHAIPVGMERDPLFASVLRETFDHLPPALIIVAEIDPLRDEAEVYQEKLQSAGVPCEIFEVKGVLHAFFTQPGIYKTTAPLAYDKASDFIKTFKK